MEILRKGLHDFDSLSPNQKGHLHAPPRDFVAYIDEAIREVEGHIVPATEQLP
jgi:hypothetical protein